MPFYECTGCGVVNTDSELYLKNIQKSKAHSCCPERKMELISESNNLDDIPLDKAIRFKTGSE